MREGSVFRPCTRCKRRATTRDRRCSACSHERFTWGYVVDLALPGAPRNQRRKIGFATKAEALDDMHRTQAERAAGTYVEPSKLTVAAYLERWLEGGCGGHIRRSTLTSYDGAVRLHIAPRIGATLLQRLDKAAVKALYQELRTGGYTVPLEAGRHVRCHNGGAGPPWSLVEERPQRAPGAAEGRCRRRGRGAHPHQSGGGSAQARPRRGA